VARIGGEPVARQARGRIGTVVDQSGPARERPSGAAEVDPGRQAAGELRNLRGGRRRAHRRRGAGGGRAGRGGSGGRGGGGGGGRVRERAAGGGRVPLAAE